MIDGSHCPFLITHPVGSLLKLINGKVLVAVMQHGCKVEATLRTLCVLEFSEILHSAELNDEFFRNATSCIQFFLETGVQVGWSNQLKNWHTPTHIFIPEQYFLVIFLSIHESRIELEEIIIHTAILCWSGTRPQGPFSFFSSALAKEAIIVGVVEVHATFEKKDCSGSTQIAHTWFTWVQRQSAKKNCKHSRILSFLLYDLLWCGHLSCPWFLLLCISWLIKKS